MLLWKYSYRRAERRRHSGLCRLRLCQRGILVSYRYWALLGKCRRHLRRILSRLCQHLVSLHLWRPFTKTCPRSMALQCNYYILGQVARSCPKVHPLCTYQGRNLRLWSACRSGRSGRARRLGQMGKVLCRRLICRQSSDGSTNRIGLGGKASLYTWV